MKLTNWFADRESHNDYKTDSQAEPLKPKSSTNQLQIEKLTQKLQSYQKELTQTKAQLQIQQGFQIELGETQLKLRKVEAELQRSKKDLFEQQKQFSSTQAQYLAAQQSLSTLTQSQSWPSQIKTPVIVSEIVKTLPKQDFETLWGFGILEPNANSTLTSGAILVQGWVLGKRASAKTVRVLYQGQKLLETIVELRRPVVAQQYPDISNARHSGFEFALSVAGIPEAVELVLETQLEDQTLVPLCNFILKPRINESNDT